MYLLNDILKNQKILVLRRPTNPSFDWDLLVGKAKKYCIKENIAFRLRTLKDPHSSDIIYFLLRYRHLLGLFQNLMLNYSHGNLPFYFTQLFEMFIISNTTTHSITSINNNWFLFFYTLTLITIELTSLH